MHCPQSQTFLRHAMNPGEEIVAWPTNFANITFLIVFEDYVHRALFCWRGRGKCWPRNSVLTRPTNLSKWVDRTCQQREQSGVTSGKVLETPQAQLVVRACCGRPFAESIRDQEKSKRVAFCCIDTPRSMTSMKIRCTYDWIRAVECQRTVCIAIL
jgi:hypothetical protein